MSYNPTMAIERGIHVIDGSHLFASITRVWRDHEELQNKKLKIDVFTRAVHSYWTPYTGPAIRSIYYFKKGDKRLKTMLDIPSSQSPNHKSHWQINECAQSVTSIPDSEIQKLDPKYHDLFHKAEKGLDMELACDALQLVADRRIDSVGFLVNDRDYIPLFKALQRLGANTYISGLDIRQPVQKSLVDLADLYHTFESDLDLFFGYTPATQSSEE